VLFPVVNEKLSKTDQVARIYRSSTKFVLAIVSFAFVASIVFGRSILSVWIGDEVAERAVVILPIHIATFGMLASATVAWHILESFGRARANAIFSLCWLLIGTSLMFAFGRSYGLEGIAIARFIGCVGVVPLAVFVERELLNSFSTSYWIVSLARLAAAAAAATAAQGIIIGILDGIVSVVIGIGVSGVAFAGVLFAVRYFDADELNWLRRSLRPADS
jgi:O-antigen/teichoic acid export membrane protein